MRTGLGQTTARRVRGASDRRSVRALRPRRPRSSACRRGGGGGLPATAGGAFRRRRNRRARRRKHRPQPCQLSLRGARSEEHTSELQSLMRISYAVFCLKKKKTNKQTKNH